MVTPILHSFELVIATSSNFLMKTCLRATYFRSFNTKSEAITFKFIKMWERYSEQHNIRVRNRFDIANALDFFEYNYSIRHILSKVCAAGQQEALHESFYRIMLPPERRSDALADYREKFYAHGLYGLLDEWVKRDFAESPDEMAGIIHKIVDK